MPRTGPPAELESLIRRWYYMAFAAVIATPACAIISIWLLAQRSGNTSFASLLFAGLNTEPLAFSAASRSTSAASQFYLLAIFLEWPILLTLPLVRRRLLANWPAATVVNWSLGGGLAGFSVAYLGAYLVLPLAICLGYDGMGIGGAAIVPAYAPFGALILGGIGYLVVPRIKDVRASIGGHGCRSRYHVPQGSG